MPYLRGSSFRHCLTARRSTHSFRWPCNSSFEPSFSPYFSVRVRNFAQKRAIPLSKYSKGAIKPTLPTPRKPAEYESLSEKLALRTSPTLLYQASSYNHYIVACYMVGGFLISVGALNAQTPSFARPGDLPAYVPVFAAVGSFAIACIGFWMCLKVDRSSVAHVCLTDIP